MAHNNLSTMISTIIISLLTISNLATTTQAISNDIIFKKTKTPFSTYFPKKKPTNPKSPNNAIDSCWRGRADWASNRQALADCAVGFGSTAIGGRKGKIYTVTSPGDDPVDPRPGTLRYGAVQDDPLWIVFAEDMVIRLKNELIVNSYKTIDGRGYSVEIGYGPCITIQGVSHVIVHGISVHDCEPGNYGMVRSSPSHVGTRLGSDGDAITVYGSEHVWIDHCFFSKSRDGLVDVVYASTAVTISNNYFTQHDKVMLLGHNDEFSEDKIMKVTVVYNRFGPGLIERMPRVRFGYAHVANNRYDAWQMYAIGGSANPTIFSEGNHFTASETKSVTKRLHEDYSDSDEKNWKWRSSKDVFKNGAFFVQSGYGTCNPNYTPNQAFTVLPGSCVPSLTSSAGPLRCIVGKPC